MPLSLMQCRGRLSLIRKDGGCCCVYTVFLTGDQYGHCHHSAEGARAHSGEEVSVCVTAAVTRATIHVNDLSVLSCHSHAISACSGDYVFLWCGDGDVRRVYADSPNESTVTSPMASRQHGEEDTADLSILYTGEVYS